MNRDHILVEKRSPAESVVDGLFKVVARREGVQMGTLFHGTRQECQGVAAYIQELAVSRNATRKLLAAIGRDSDGSLSP